jgi:hypothetical protein
MKIVIFVFTLSLYEIKLFVYSNSTKKVVTQDITLFLLSENDLYEK